MVIIRTSLGVLFFLCLLNGLAQNSVIINNYDKSIPIETTTTDSVISGKQLAAIYCKMCHKFPEPELLDKDTWVNSVLPNMGLRLGINKSGVNPYDELLAEEVKIIKPLGVYPDTPLISIEDWDKIVEYYKTEAPSIPIEQKLKIPVSNLLPNFEINGIVLGDKSMPMTSMLEFDKSSNRLYVGDAHNTIYILNDKMQIHSEWTIPNIPVDIDFPKNAAPRVLTIGVFRPSDRKLGGLNALNVDEITNFKPINIQSLARPVCFTVGDLNMDDKEDVIICEFGNHSGKLVWLDDFDTTKQHILKELPGARMVEIKDFNNDNKPDIMVLMAQAHEQVSIFYNQGDNNFTEKVVLSFPPVYGVSYFELLDFNNDGYLDILLTNGDNWDYSPIRKNYHGIRLYLNDGYDNFNEAFFYPLYGAVKAVARDFDNDGDLDISGISFYSDFDQPEQSFVYLSNNGDMTFKAFSTPEAANGKWLTMEVADYDNDGDLDIILGSYFHTVSEMTKLIFKGVTTFPQLIVLTNELK
jgi:hypothetical protein